MSSLRRALSQLPALEYTHVTSEMPLEELLVWLGCREMQAVIDELKKASPTGV